MDFTELIERTFGVPLAAKRSLLQQYAEMISALANNDEVDADYFAEVNSKLEKTKKQVTDDVDGIRLRRPQQTELTRLQKIQSSIPKLTADVEKTRKAFDDAYQKFQPPLAEAQQALTDAQSEILQLPGLESKLVETVLDPELRRQRSELSQQRMAIAGKLKPLSDARVLCQQYHSFYVDEIVRIERDRRESSRSDIAGRTALNQKLSQSKQNESSSSKRLKQLSTEISELQAQLAVIDEKQETLRLEMLAS